MTISRKQLYDQVWQEPMCRLAQRYGISDVGLAKICRKHDIPIPARGYWAKKQAGHNPPQIALPHPSSDVSIDLPDARDVAAVSAELDAAIAAERAKDAPVVVADNLRGSHTLVSAANQELQSAQTDEYGLIVPPENVDLDIHVAKVSIRRALLVMDAILKALEQRGYNVKPGPTVTLLGVSLRFGISEALEVQQEEPEEHDLEGHYTFGHSRFIQKKVPSGRLTLRIDHGQEYWTSGCRQTWRDGSKSGLEERLNSFITGLIKVAARLKEREEELERQAQERRLEEQRRQERARLRAEKRALIKAERARVEKLMQWARDWNMSQTVRAFIQATGEARLTDESIIPSDEEFERWAGWATQQADRMDPLKASPPSILDEEVEEEEDDSHRRYGRSW